MEKKKNVLVIYVYDTHHELVETSTRLISERGVKVDAICVSTFRTCKNTGTRWSAIIYLADFFINKLRIPKMQGLFNNLLGKRYFKKIIDKYDIVDFQSFPTSQYGLADYCISQNKEFIISFWGSDAMLADNEELHEMKRYLDYSKAIKLNEKIGKKLCDYYNNFSLDYTNKFTGTIKGITNGNKDIFLLNSLTEEDVNKLKRLFCNEGKNKLLVTIGYNGIPMQNQDKVINLLSTLPTEVKNKIHIILPMTYNTPPEHLFLVKSLACKTGVTYTILEKFLSNKEVCVLRKITDIFIMMEDIDGFSGSVRSHVYCQNVCLIGDWLDYPMEKEGVFYLKVNWDNLYNKFIEVISHYEDFHEKCLLNKEKMLPFMAWDKYIDLMCYLYK